MQNDTGKTGKLDHHGGYSRLPGMYITTLGRYQATDAAGNTVRYQVAEGPRGTGYTVARAVYPQFVEEPEQVTAASIQDFQRLKKWLKEEKGKNTNMQKEPS